MKHKEKTIAYTEYNSLDALQEGDRYLLEQAFNAAEKAYSPYSRFPVGAAVLLSTGLVVTGSNQENAAFPSGLCAERVAMFAANAQYPEAAMVAIAVASLRTNECEDALFPCGACRQVMSEYEYLANFPLRIIVCGGKQKILIFDGISHLLPFGFSMPK